jgi:hypothetical protein
MRYQAALRPDYAVVCDGEAHLGRRMGEGKAKPASRDKAATPVAAIARAPHRDGHIGNPGSLSCSPR